jgi:hypothetical protein
LRRQAVGGGEILDRLLVLFLALIDQPAAVERLDVVRIEGEGAIEFRQRLLVLAGLGEHLAAGGIALRVADATRADIVGRFLRHGLRLWAVRTPRSQIERAAAQRYRQQRDKYGRMAHATRKRTGGRNGLMAECSRVHGA